MTVEGRRVRVSNLEKVLYPETGTTKRDVLEYLQAAAPAMLPHCRDRAATRKRWPDGVEGQMFFQKDIGDGAPDWLELRTIQHSDHANRYPLVNDLPSLVWLGQLAALEVHVPQWRFGRGDEPRHPDRIVLDLDPGPGVSLIECADVARLVRDILDDMGLVAVPVTSGSKGIHVYAALDGAQSSDDVSRVARELARALEADHPNEIVSSMKRSKREGRVLIDWSQNNASKTTIAPYSLRGRARPTVAAPRTWRELGSRHLRQLEYSEVLERIARRGDPMATVAEATGRADGGDVSRDRLEIYRSKRDRRKTSEPIPDAVASAGSGVSAESDTGPVFVIQKHDASRLHYDFRVEHDGVLVSWALPKGVPTDSRQNRLAVPTEDHPMDYRFFSGTIPKGEYGAGTVEIWDTGSAAIEKWRDDEVIVTLTGADDGGLGGRRRYALFRTRNDPKKPQWMIHLMQDQGSDPSPGASRRGDSRASRRTAPRTSESSGGRTTSSKTSHAVAPMLATRGRSGELSALEPNDWAFEMKWDGMRAVIAVTGDGVRVTSRNGQDVTETYPELASLGAALGADGVVLDGEIVAFDARGAASFSRLQRRMNVTSDREIRELRRSIPVWFAAFDVLGLNGQDATALPYRDRRELLEEVVDEVAGVPIFAPPAFEGDAAAAERTSRELGCEGVMAKRLTSVYRPGTRTSDWLKFPHGTATEVIVVGWRVSESDPDGIASLLLAVPGESGLTYAGRVGTGFSNAERRRIRDRLARVERQTPPVDSVPPADRRDARWVTPKLVGDVSFREFTDEGRFRQPVWRGWRTDQSVDDVRAPEG
ncbi:ATP-dependent DNA ligase [Leucobacter tardus]|uniref:DNA ligase (ATP) n=1 Tax=Leucobacter tardus TaxID=501483 RepID=A0A939QD81_9MICO|nr:ATP-dependent DNA ligase [Leucobacter tardus]